MKKMLFLGCMVSLLACSQKKPTNEGKTKTDEDLTVLQSKTATPAFDSIRAVRLGADAYGMRKYVMAFLKRGPNRSQDSATAARLQMAHMENIGEMAEAGKLVLAGPFLGDGDLRGIYIFAVESIEEAEALTRTDPAIQAGSLEMELTPWYGSAALMEVNEIHKNIARIDI